MDIHIRKNIKPLTAAECAEIADGCQRIYRDHIDSLSNDGYAHSDDIPAAASRVGYKKAIVRKESVEFRAGAGAFSQVGPIIISCRIDPETMTATDLRLDNWRLFDPARGEFVTQ